MKNIHVSKIIESVKDCCIKANYYLTEDVKEKIISAKEQEKYPLAKEVLGDIEENFKISEKGVLPLCQDTGMTCVFIEIGQDVHIEGGSLEAAINEGVRQGYAEGYLRKSVVADPLFRNNTGDNTPAIINYEIKEGDKLRILIAPKGFGSENMSAIKMLKPSDGVEGAKEFIINTVKEAGPNPCPPIIVGVGIGGTFERAALLSKKALLRNLNESNSNEYYKTLEEELLEKINSLGIGPQGFGGRHTALKVNIENYPTHIAGLPVAVNISCHSLRHHEIIL